MTIRRDARPFLAHHLRQRGDERKDLNGADIHQLARWVENLPADDGRMARVEATEAIDYRDGSVNVGPDATALIEGWVGDADTDLWLDRFARVIERQDLDS